MNCPKPMAVSRSKKLRLDQALVQEGVCSSREKARRSILAGQVKVNGHKASKSSDLVLRCDRIELVEPERFVSRGGYKLEHALGHFRIEVAGLVAIDLGAATGGFTDCLLQHGAAKVYAVDVGHGQLAWTLRQDRRVVAMEKVNARSLAPNRFPPPFDPVDLVVVDCSFISLRKILPVAAGLLRRPGRVVALIKPQFEAGKAEADRGAGVIRDPSVHRRVLDDLRSFVEAETSLKWAGLTESPLLGPAGNKEFLVLLEKES